MVPAGTTPLVPFAGVTENPASLQTAVVMEVIAGLGLTVTVMLNEAPVQVPHDGVMV